MVELYWTEEAKHCLQEIRAYIAQDNIIYYTHYRIAYLIVNEQRIDIIGIFHGAMELRKYLR